jgi:hypothetical protein
LPVASSRCSVSSGSYSLGVGIRVRPGVRGKSRLRTYPWDSTAETERAERIV